MTVSDASTTFLTYDCDVCGKPILDQEGGLEVDDGEVAAYENAHQQYKATQAAKEAAAGGPVAADLSAVFSLPPRATWRMTHTACSPEDRGYFIEVHRLRETGALLGWTLHLADKNWWSATKWDEWVQSTCRRNGVRIDF